MSAMEL